MNNLVFIYQQTKQQTLREQVYMLQKMGISMANFNMIIYNCKY